MRGILRRVRRRRLARLGEAIRDLDARAEDGHWDESRARLEELLSRSPEHAGALRRLAGMLQLEGRAGDAEALWRRLVALRPERADANLQLARLLLRRGERAEALPFAEAALAHAEPGAPHAIAHRARSTRDHLERGETPLAGRHVAIGGMSFCGSTLLGYLLGSHPDVSNVGESHALAYRRQGMRPIPVDYASDDPEGMVRCTLCAEAPCPVWTLPFRRALAADPVDWYGKLVERAGTSALVSSDKSHAKLSGLDPFGRHDLVVLFKSPESAFSSARRRPRPPKDAGRYVTRWELEYRRLLHDLPVRGRRVVLHFDAFRRDPERHLRRLLEQLELTAPEGVDLLAVDPEQHVIGGNRFTRRDVRATPDDLEIRSADAHDLPTAEREEIARREARSGILRELLDAHEASFGC